MDLPKAPSSHLGKGKILSTILSTAELNSSDLQLRFLSTVPLLSTSASHRDKGCSSDRFSHGLLPEGEDLLWLEILQLLAQDDEHVAKESKENEDEKMELTAL